jgi:hypothetical protein
MTVEGKLYIKLVHGKSRNYQMKNTEMLLYFHTNFSDAL